MPHIDLEQHLEQFLRRQQYLDVHTPVRLVLAYSGGKDSTALLEALYQLKTKKYPNLQIYAAYYWHAWRPVEHDLEVIHQNCWHRKIRWIVLTPDLTLPKTEANARDDRYNQLSKLALNIGAKAVLTAHHLDDQIETILFRLFRGSGLEGLKGVRESRTHIVNETAVTILRPFIEIPANELERYGKIQKVVFAHDPTNDSTAYKRNYLRHEIIPKIAEAFPQFRNSLKRLIQQAESEVFLSKLAINERWEALYDQENNSIDFITLLQMTPSLRNAILRRFLMENNISCNFDRLDVLNDYLSGTEHAVKASSIFSLGDNIYLSLYRNRLTIQRPDKKTISPIPLTIPTSLCIPELGYQVTIREITGEVKSKHIDFKSLSPMEAYLDLSKYIQKPLTLRVRQDGDRIHPLGMKESIKLKRLFNNREITRFDRDNILLLASEDEILWAIGVEVSENAKIKRYPTHHIVIKPIETQETPALPPNELSQLFPLPVAFSIR